MKLLFTFPRRIKWCSYIVVFICITTLSSCTFNSSKSASQESKTPLPPEMLIPTVDKTFNQPTLTSNDPNSTTSDNDNAIRYTYKKTLYEISLIDGNITEIGLAPPKGGVSIPDGSFYWIELEYDQPDPFIIVPFKLMKKTDKESIIFTDIQLQALYGKDIGYRQSTDEKSHLFPPELEYHASKDLILVKLCVEDLPRYPCKYYYLDPKTDILTFLNVDTEKNAAWISSFGDSILYPNYNGEYHLSQLNSKKDQKSIPLDISSYYNNPWIANVVWLSDESFIAYSAEGLIWFSNDGKNKVELDATNSFNAYFIDYLLLSPNKNILVYRVIDSTTEQHKATLMMLYLEGKSRNRVIGDVPFESTDYKWK